jgi:signal transduction histidine kinase
MAMFERSAPRWFNELEDGVILIRAGVIVDINRAAAMMLDVNADKVAGRTAIAVLRDHRLEQAYRDGSTIELNTRGRMLRVWGIAGGLCLRDISAMSRAQENARELLAVLSHELRTPVTTIRSTLEALHYDLPDAQRQRFLHRAETETQRLMRLLEDLTIDVKPPHARSLDIEDLVSRALGLLHDTFAERNIAVTCDLEPLTVWADTDKLLQVLINLLENAAIHGPQDATIYLNVCKHAFVTADDATSYVQRNPEDDRIDGDRVDGDRVEVARVTPKPSEHHHQRVIAEKHAVLASHKPTTNTDMAHITVRDLGTPLEPTIIESLFEPHAQGSPKSKGTGLGLYIVRSIAARWGGEAWGKPYADGNEFGVSVPLSRR